MMCQSHLHLGYNKINKLIHFHNQKEKFSFKIKNLMKRKQEIRGYNIKTWPILKKLKS